jgi:hypothetical protein
VYGEVHGPGPFTVFT